MFNKISDWIDKKMEERSKRKIEKMKKKFERDREMEIIRRESIPGQVWQVTKSVKVHGKKGSRIVNLKMYDHRPTAKEIYDDFYETYGGGAYAIKTLIDGQFRIKTEMIDGEPKVVDPSVLEPESEKNGHSTESTSSWKEKVFRKVLENDPELSKKWVSNIISSEIDDGVSYEEQITKDVLKSDPNMRREFVRARIAATLGVSDTANPPDEFEGLDRVLSIIEKMNDIIQKNDRKSHGTISALIESGAIGDIARIIGNLTEPERRATTYLPYQQQPKYLPDKTQDSVQSHYTQSVQKPRRDIPPITPELKYLLNYASVITKYIQKNGNPKIIAKLIQEHSPEFAKRIAKETPYSILKKIRPYAVYPEYKPHIIILFRNKKWVVDFMKYIKAIDIVGEKVEDTENIERVQPEIKKEGQIQKKEVTKSVYDGSDYDSDLDDDYDSDLDDDYDSDLDDDYDSDLDDDYDSDLDDDYDSDLDDDYDSDLDDDYDSDLDDDYDSDLDDDYDSDLDDDYDSDLDDDYDSSKKDDNHIINKEGGELKNDSKKDNNITFDDN